MRNKKRTTNKFEYLNYEIQRIYPQNFAQFIITRASNFLLLKSTEPRGILLSKICRTYTNVSSTLSTRNITRKNDRTKLKSSIYIRKVKQSLCFTDFLFCTVLRDIRGRERKRQRERKREKRREREK